MRTNPSFGLMFEMAVFTRVVECGSFSAAARQLGATPSAVSRSVSRLEQSLGTRLLERTTRKLRLSESGNVVYGHGREMLEAAQAARTAASGLSDEPTGLVRISVPKAVGHLLIHPLLPAFLERYPKVDVHVRLADREVDLIDGEVDLAIRITDQPPPGLMGRRLLEIEHLLCASPHYLAQHGCPTHPHDLKQHSCLYLGEDPSDARWKFRKGEQALVVPVRGRYAANHSGMRLDAVLRHIGIASLPYFVARSALEQGQIQAVPADWVFRTRYCAAPGYSIRPPAIWRPSCACW